MALSWNEIKDRALHFSKEWSDETRERAEKDSFWNDFFNVFGISRRRVATFEEPVKKLGNKQGFIDLFWKGKLLVEHKSKGKNLDKAFQQAIDYFPGLKEEELPKYILVSDFEKFKLYDLDEKIEIEFHISELYKYVKQFGFIAGYKKHTFKQEDPVNIKAAELMGELHDQLKEFGYKGHPLEVYLVRLLFILFADDTGIFEKDYFKQYIEFKTNEDGCDLGALLAQLFQVLNTTKENRLKTLDEDLNQFPYINGGLFKEVLPIAAFNSRMRSILLKASDLDWGKISPAIFGSLFQSVMNPSERRDLGAHYTSENNILKLIKPLFLDKLRQEFEEAKSSSKKLNEFHKKLSTLRFLDPACGSGNFLIITYRELRQLEIDILRESFKYSREKVLDISSYLWINVDQFYGIEYDEFASKIAEVAMWLIDHQMNMKISEEFGQYYIRLPLTKSAKIVNENSLRINWEEVVSSKELTYILGNPPFYGYSYQTKEQKEDMKIIFKNIKGAGVLDYVAAWYYLSACFIKNTNIKVGFVSTNSITQGEQVSILWEELMEKYNISIHFAHTTFNWTNEAKGKAAVHCVIIGFANYEIKNKYLFEYEDINSQPHIKKVKNINPYLVDANNIFIRKRSNPLCNVPKMTKGSSPTDGGHLILDENEKNDLVNESPIYNKYIRKYTGSREYINNINRYCLWLKEVSPSELKSMPKVLERLEKIKKMRLESSKLSTQKWADFPSLFIEDRQPKDNYILIPRVSSEKRKYIPIGFVSKEVIASDSAITLAINDIYIFGVLTSLMHMSWVKYTCGRLKSDFRYSNTIVYNNFPWPKNPSEKNMKKVKELAQNLLDIRDDFKTYTLSDLYDPLTMPPQLVKIHKELDKAVDLCYRPQAFTTENLRIEFLFNLYNEYI